MGVLGFEVLQFVTNAFLAYAVLGFDSGFDSGFSNYGKCKDTFRLTLVIVLQSIKE
jgi:hypothetical protein